MLVTNETAVLKARSGERAAKALRVQRQEALHPQYAVEQREAGCIEQEHRQRIGAPALLPGGIDARQSIEAALDGTEYRREEGGLAGVDLGHEGAERHGRQQDSCENDDDLEPAIEGHGIGLLEAFRPDQRQDEIAGEAQGDDAAEKKIEGHGSASLKAARPRGHTAPSAQRTQGR